MTTAHRPTWKSAYGLSDNVNKGYVPTRSYSARDLPSYLKLKERQWGQGSVQQLRQKDFKAQLLKRQAEAKRKKNGGLQIIQQDEKGGKRSLEDAEIDYIDEYESIPKKRIAKPGDIVQQQSQKLQNPFPQDEDSQDFIKQDRQERGRKRVNQDDDESDDDDDSELLREYQKIKQQRQKQQLFKREQKHKASVMNRQEQLLKGNPITDSTFSLSKRWYEDTVFRNQAKKTEEKKSFVNDYVRSDFHRKFMNRYVMR